VSFRLRLFFTAAAIVAAVLALVMAIGWSRVMHVELDRLDVRLCSEAKRLAKEKFPAQELPRLEADMLQKLGLTSRDQLLVQFDETPQGTRFQSPRWDEVIQNAKAWRQGDLPANPAPPIKPPAMNLAQATECSFSSFQSGADPWRVVVAADHGAKGTVAANLIAPTAAIQKALLSALTIELPIALLLTALGAAVLSALTMRPVNRLRESMKVLTPARLDQRLKSHGEDHEFAELIHAYNTMLDRLEQSFTQASRFSADAAHELKTPLTILRGRLEQARRKTTDAKLQEDFSDLLDEVGRLSAITRKLLLLSQADAGLLDLNTSTVNLSEMLTDMATDMSMLVDDRQLSSMIAPSLNVKGDKVLLQQLLNNLLSNAVRYSSAGGTINVAARKCSAGVEVLVQNNCQPISNAERKEFFRRFFRGDAAHNRQVDGHGLGLSLALEIAKAHGGALTLQPGPDTEVCLKLVLPIE
jgi:heavy metal sensor kinase